MTWIYLSLAILLEVLGTVNMKLSEGFTKITPAILMFIFYLTSFAFLTLSLKKLDVSIAYAIWSGVGVALITIIGYFLFGERLSVTKVTAIFLIIIGVVMLNLTDSSEDTAQSDKEVTAHTQVEKQLE